MSRQFLRDLVVNDGLTASGAEYCLPEVQMILVEKESRHAERETTLKLIEYARELEASATATPSIPLIMSPENCVNKEQTASMKPQPEGGSMNNKDNSKSNSKSNSKGSSKSGRKPSRRVNAWPGPTEQRIRLGKKPKALAYDDTVDLLKEWGNWVEAELESLRILS